MVPVDFRSEHGSLDSCRCSVWGLQGKSKGGNGKKSKMAKAFCFLYVHVKQLGERERQRTADMLESTFTRTG